MDIYEKNEWKNQNGLNNIIDLKQFGVVGDGKKDDTKKIQEAINMLPEEGGTIIVPSGTYLISKPLIIDKKATFFQGYGAAYERDGKIIRGSTFFLSNNSDCNMLEIIDSAGTRWGNTTIKNICFNGNKGNQELGSGIALFGVRYVRIEDCLVTRIKENGIIGSNHNKKSLNGCWLSRNVLTYCGRNGIKWVGSDSFILNNSIGISEENGLLLGSGGNIIIGNHIWINGKSGIACNSKKEIIVGNKVNHSKSNGINIIGAKDINLIGNKIFNNGIDYNLNDKKRSGIRITRLSNNIIINGNTCGNDTRKKDEPTQIYGIYIDGKSKNIIMNGNNGQGNVKSFLYLHNDSQVLYHKSIDNTSDKNISMPGFKLITDADFNKRKIYNIVIDNGNTRPHKPELGQLFFDTSIGKPIYFNGLHWIDSNGKKV